MRCISWTGTLTIIITLRMVVGKLDNCPSRRSCRQGTIIIIKTTIKAIVTHTTKTKCSKSDEAQTTQRSLLVGHWLKNHQTKISSGRTLNCKPIIKTKIIIIMSHQITRK